MTNSLIKDLCELRETYHCGSDRWILLNDAANEITLLRSELAGLRASSTTPALGEWRPIESAPRDGTQFLAYDECELPSERYWVADEPAGATHWMPLPASPERATAREGAGSHRKR